ncbi:hypothetical protein COS54_02200 [Candidatus Shapirobacteria bacterium CG03_land_8_20_14_0_80_39_12]|uniref:Uncharacterized protein n=1 Tax=Candidatus Shapirobacteria bacterium CG03_land_8_20_14_0_80_39_12 TaxID=1974879 RepID=A0A2M7BCQ8_9BACT|nr:MAG: hypothetical protein COS54_02200 [Candidatus Shapirobacteria bacterium CG03_land_8_20_14_0_80_39_12]
MHEEKREKIVVFILVLFDQLTKFFSLKMDFGQINHSVSWGLLPFWSNSILIVIISFLLFFLWRFKSKTGVWLMLVGGMSNLLDRIIRGGVVDFLKLPLIPTFNMADVAICFGAAWFIVDFVKTKTLS